MFSILVVVVRFKNQGYFVHLYLASYVKVGTNVEGPTEEGVVQVVD